MRSRPSFFAKTNNPGRVNLVNAIGFALWAYTAGTGTDAKIASDINIGVPSRFEGSSNLVPRWMVTSNPLGTVVAFVGTTELEQWLSYITQLGASPCAGVGGQTFAPFETWASEIADRLIGQIPADNQTAFVGHSLGGAMAHLCAAKLAARGFATPVVYTSGCPLIGDVNFVEAYLPTANNIVRVADPVPGLPPSSLSNPLFCPGLVPLLPRMYRPGVDWTLPAERLPRVNVAAWVVGTGPLLWIKQLPATVRALHSHGRYLKQAWDLLDHEDKAEVNFWAIIASNFWGLDLIPV